MPNWGPEDLDPSVGPPGFHTTARELQTCTFDVPGATNTTKIPREDTQREREKERHGGEGEEKERNLAVRRRGSTEGGSGGRWSREVQTSNNHNNAKPRTSGAPKGWPPLPSKVQGLGLSEGVGHNNNTTTQQQQQHKQHTTTTTTTPENFAKTLKHQNWPKLVWPKSVWPKSVKTAFLGCRLAFLFGRSGVG